MNVGKYRTGQLSQLNLVETFRRSFKMLWTPSSPKGWTWGFSGAWQQLRPDDILNAILIGASETWTQVYWVPNPITKPWLLWWKTTHTVHSKETYHRRPTEAGLVTFYNSRSGNLTGLFFDSWAHKGNQNWWAGHLWSTGRGTYTWHSAS